MSDMKRRLRFLGGLIIFVLLATLASCAHVNTSYEQASAVQPADHPVEQAIRFYDQDIPTIAHAGGKVIGYLSANGNGFSSFGDVDEAALKQAALQGGTHVIRTNADVETTFVQIADGQMTVRCNGGYCSGSYSDPTYMPIRKPSARFVVIRVPCQNWDKLPEPLRPVSYTGCDADSDDSQPAREAETPRPPSPRQEVEPPPAPVGVVRGKPFPGQIAGYPFGIGAADFKSTCEGVGGTFVVSDKVKGLGSETIACSKAAAFVPFQVRAVFARMCGAWTCEYELILPEEWERRDVARVRQLLVDRYGPAVDFRSRSFQSACLPESKMIRSSWMWLQSGKSAPVGSISVIYDCSPSDTKVYASVFYANEAGSAKLVAERPQGQDW